MKIISVVLAIATIKITYLDKHLGATTNLSRHRYLLKSLVHLLDWKIHNCRILLHKEHVLGKSLNQNLSEENKFTKDWISLISIVR